MDIDRCDLWSVILRSRDPGVAELSFVCDLIWYVCRCVYIYMYTYICIYIYVLLSSERLISAASSPSAGVALQISSRGNVCIRMYL